ncbi:ficolin-2-like [Asterias amurensis]|uniref:ficolin-2-like n=1 Tax=Asterias amurensis TaxID=7602 RepID=UPI003AB50A7C
MGLFIRSLLVILIVKSQVELQVEASSNQRTVSCDVDTNSKVAELRLIVENYLVILEDELRNTQDQVKELKVIMTDNHETVSSELEDTRRTMAAISTNQETATSEQEETRRMVSELQTAARRTMAAISTNQETATSEQEETRRMVSELQVAVTTNQQMVTVALRNTTLQLKDIRREMGVSGRQVEELQESVSMTKIHGVRDCSDVLARGEARSGVYAVKPDSGRPFKVYCDMETDGGGWTVFQRRQDGSVDFFLDFANYSRGFGNLEGEFWLGNDNLHRLTAQGEYELRVDLTGFDDDTGFAVYDSFTITDVSDNYTLTVGKHSGTARDMLSYHNNMAFSTKDRDNDAYSSNCAEWYGAWWYRACFDSNLNGRYLNESSAITRGEMRWNGFSGSRSLKTTEMKIRREV